MRVYITAAADDDVVMKPNKPPPQQQAAARRGCRSAVVTGLLAGVLLFRAALLAVEAGASLCPSAAGKVATTSHFTVHRSAACCDTTAVTPLRHFRAFRLDAWTGGRGLGAGCTAAAVVAATPWRNL
ncbi:unnamed protein product [Urochloa humidicola]